MNRINLDLCGTAKWFEFVGCDVSRPQKAPQASVLEAVRFVMEQLRPEIRGSASLGSGTYKRYTRPSGAAPGQRSTQNVRLPNPTCASIPRLGIAKAVRRSGKAASAYKPI